MISTVKKIWRLARAGRTLARYDFFMQPEQVSDLPWFARALLKTAKFGAAAPFEDANTRVTAALSSLGPSYIKLGQFLSTRPDVIGAKRAFEIEVPAGPLATLQHGGSARHHSSQSWPEC